MRTSSVRSTWVRNLGWLSVLAGLLGVASAAVLLVAPPAVGPDRLSYPFTAQGFMVAQVWFAVHHLGLTAGILGLLRSGALGPSRLGLVGTWGAMAGMLLLSATELLAISSASGPVTDAQGGLLGGLYGLSTTVAGAGLILAGVAVLRPGLWSGWRRFVPLALGIWVFVPMTPALFAGFVVARFAIGGWMAGFALLGWALVTSDRLPAPIPMAMHAGVSR